MNRLLLLVKDTKFESKSQLDEYGKQAIGNCFYWSKIQNLKANHNFRWVTICHRKIAFTGQRYKIWKQITTKLQKFKWLHNCFYWSKIQNLKANHNFDFNVHYRELIAFTGQRYKIWKQITTFRTKYYLPRELLLLVKDTKFESKSQRGTTLWTGHVDCFYWSKIQNLKTNHNHNLTRMKMNKIAFIGQRYKIWKQITTVSRYIKMSFSK